MPAKKRKRARVRVGVDQAGNPVYKWAGGYTRKELNDEIRRIEQEYAQASNDPQAEQPEPQRGKSGQTFRQYADTWFKLFKMPNIRTSTRDMYNNVFKVHLFPAFGEKPIAAITANDLQRFILEYEDSSRSLIDKIMLTLRQVFDAAADDDLIARSPVGKMRPPEGTTGERLPLTVEAVDALTKAAMTHSDGLLPILMLYTGLRRGEALALRWDDIDGDFIHVRRAVVYEGNHVAAVGETKTKAALRSIPMMPALAAKLGKRGKGYVFGGDRVLPYTTYKTMWERLQRDIDALKDVSPHRLRHTYLMLLRRAGVDPATQQYLMGHSDYETTANDYTHIDAADVKEAKKKMVKLLPKLLPQAR